MQYPRWRLWQLGVFFWESCAFSWHLKRRACNLKSDGYCFISQGPQYWAGTDSNLRHFLFVSHYDNLRSWLGRHLSGSAEIPTGLSAISQQIPTQFPPLHSCPLLWLRAHFLPMVGCICSRVYWAKNSPWNHAYEEEISSRWPVEPHLFKVPKHLFKVEL